MVAVGEFDVPEVFGTSSLTRMANQYGVLGLRPVTVKLSVVPAMLGTGGLGTTVAAGGDTAAAIERMGLASKLSHDRTPHAKFRSFGRPYPQSSPRHPGRYHGGCRAKRECMPGERQ